MILLDADYNVLAWGVDEKTRIGQIFNDHHLTLYVEEGRSTSIKSVTALKYFRSIALTLPDPANHGGIYALRMPVTQVTAKDGVILPSDYIDVTISANDNSNIWSEIAYPCQYIAILKINANNRGETNHSNPAGGWNRWQSEWNPVADPQDELSTSVKWTYTSTTFSQLDSSQDCKAVGRDT